MPIRLRILGLNSESGETTSLDLDMPLEQDRTLDNPTWRTTFAREMAAILEASGYDYCHITVLGNAEISFDEIVIGPGNAPTSRMLN